MYIKRANQLMTGCLQSNYSSQSWGTATFPYRVRVTSIFIYEK